MNVEASPPVAEPPTVEHVMHLTRRLLQFAEIGRQIAATSSQLAMVDFGAYSLAVYGRSVTFVLQNLRSVPGLEEDFNKWYAPKQKLMKNDPLLRWFHDVRTSLLHTVAVDIHQLSETTILSDGGVVVEVIAEFDGRTFTLPVPREHLGKKIPDRSIGGLGTQYLAYLRDLVDEADRMWS